jgi:hypothetical protein
MPVLEAIKVNARALQVMNERIAGLPYERILDCFYHPDRNRGALELILAESFLPRKR